MSETKLPVYIPIVAADGGSYPAGSDPWSGTELVVEPNAGVISAGLTPGPGSWFTAQTANFVLGTYSQAIAAMIDAPSFQLTPHAAVITNGLAYDGAATAGNGNTDPGGDPPGFMVGDDGWFYVQKRRTLTKNRLGQGLEIADGDTAEWTDTAVSPTGATGATGSGENVSSVDRPPIMCVDRDTGFVASFYAGGSMNASTDRGATWSANHVISATLYTAKGGSPASVSAAFCWNGMVFAAYSIGGGPYFSSVWVADQSDLTTWEHVFTAASNGGASNEFTRVAANATTMVWLSRVGKQLNAVTGTIGAWVNTPVQFAAHTTSSRNWRGSWNGQLGMFVIGNVEGDVWTSVNGTGWGEAFAAADNLFSTADIVAHGRGFVVSNHKTDWAADFLDVGPDGLWRLRRMLTPFAGNGAPFGAWHLESVHGRILIGRIIFDTVWRLEWYWTDVQPWDRNNFVGR